MPEPKPIPPKIDALPSQLEKAKEIIGINEIDHVVANAMKEVAEAREVERFDICTFTATKPLFGILKNVILDPGERRIRILLPTRIDNNTCSRFLEKYTDEIEKKKI